VTRVLVVEDEPALRQALAINLRARQYDVPVAATGKTALAIAARQPPDVVVLDLGLPDMDGLEVCRRLRAGRNSVPVLVLTARTDEIDLVVGLDAGADDYVAKPFRLAELLARVRALLRRRTGDVLEASGVRMELASRRVWQDDVELHLSNKEYELLRVLLEEAGAVVTRNRIMREVWDDAEGGASKTLDMHVSWLRRKLGDDPQRSRLLTTVRGVGFRFERG
jgi:DNA-binding response OmpR family regulator